MILVDTTVWIDFFNGKKTKKVELFEKYIETDRIIIADIIEIELLQGFKKEKDFKLVKEIISKLHCVQLLDTRIVVNKSIEIYRALRKKGITIRKTIDTIIASYCIVNDIKLLHDDKDFDHIAKYYPLDSIED